MTDNARPWANRIVGHGTEDPEQLLANPRNWRIHSMQQQDIMAGVLDKVGWVDEITVNQSTGFVVDGHMRIILAIRRGEQVPTKYVDLTEEEEQLVLRTFDPIAALAGADQAKLAEMDAASNGASDNNDGPDAPCRE